MMPDLDGHGVLQALQQDPAPALVPFIFLTAKSEKEDFRHGTTLGADDSLTKPVTNGDLIQAIEGDRADPNIISCTGSSSIPLQQSRCASSGTIVRALEVLNSVCR